MKKVIVFIAALVFTVSTFAQTPKYVFYFIGDGMGIYTLQTANCYNKIVGRPEVNFWNFPVRTFVTTYSLNNSITDSAAAGTALATGTKVNNGAIAYDKDGNDLVSLAEKAKRCGYAAGVATSVGVNHATPSPYYGSVKARSNYDQLAQQLIGSNIDFAAGSTFLTTKKGGKKSEDYEAEAKAAGINVFVGKDEVKKAKGRVIMLGKNHEVPYAISRKEGDTKLADFTEAAIAHLSSASPKGFFLMVEGGLIDYACHSRDAATAFHEINDMAESVALALAFYEKHPNETLIIVTSDHETGGFVNGSSSKKQKLELIDSQKFSKNDITRKMVDLQKRQAPWSDVKALLKESLGLWDTIEVTRDEEKVLTGLYKSTFLDSGDSMEKDLYSSNQLIVTEAISYFENKIGVCYSFNRHSGSVVGLFAKGAKASEFAACVDNTDIPKTIERVARYK